MRAPPSRAAARGSRLLVASIALATAMFAGRASAEESAEPPAPAPPTTPTAPSAPAPSGFGAAGSWVFTYETADIGSGFAFFHKANDKAGTTTITLNPAVDYFVAPNISLGANLFFSHSSGNGSAFGGGVRAGYDLSITETVSFWPSARYFLVHDPTPATVTSLGVFAPFLWHATTHFFLGAGPDLNAPVSGGGSTEFGLDFILGGWF